MIMYISKHLLISNHNMPDGDNCVICTETDTSDSFLWIPCKHLLQWRWWSEGAQRMLEKVDPAS